MQLFQPLPSAALVLSMLLLAGCGGTLEPKPPTRPVEPVVEQPSTEPAPKVDTPPPSIETPPPKTAGDAGLRELVAKLARKEGGKWKVDEEAKAKLEELGPQAIDQIQPLLADNSPEVRRGAAYYLLPLAASREELAEDYVKLLDDADATIRGIAMGAVGQFKPTQKATAAAAIAKVLSRTTDDEQHRATAARLLGDVGREAAPLLPQLAVAAADDASAKVRSSSLLAISRVAEPAAAVELLVKSLDDQDASVRLMALQRLRELGRDAAPAIDQLGKLLDNKDEKIRRTAGETLVRIGAKSVPVLTTALGSSSRDAREIAVIALGKMGPLAKPALPALRKRLNDSDLKVKEVAKAVVLELELE